MSAKQSSPDRRAVLASSAALAAARLIPTQADAAPVGDAVRPFNIDVPDAEQRIGRFGDVRPVNPHRKRPAEIAPRPRAHDVVIE
jgi:hypothetical protein